MLTAEEIADVPIATPAGQGVTVYDILYCAADAFASGERRWHRAGDPHDDNADCLMLSITRAARKLGCYYRAYDAVAAVQRYLPCHAERGYPDMVATIELQRQKIAGLQQQLRQQQRGYQKQIAKLQSKLAGK